MQNRKDIIDGICGTISMKAVMFYQLYNTLSASTLGDLIG